VLDAAARSSARRLVSARTTNAIDEAAWLVLQRAGPPVDQLGPYLDLAGRRRSRKAAAALVTKRIRTRKPAAYLLNEAWLGPHRFYVDERVIVPRSFIAELLRPRLVPWIGTRAGPRGPRPVHGSGLPRHPRGPRVPKAHVDAADLSPDALAVAARNVADYASASACGSWRATSSARSRGAPTTSSSPIRRT